MRILKLAVASAVIGYAFYKTFTKEDNEKVAEIQTEEDFKTYINEVRTIIKKSMSLNFKMYELSETASGTEGEDVILDLYQKISDDNNQATKAVKSLSKVTESDENFAENVAYLVSIEKNLKENITQMEDILSEADKSAEATED